MNAIMYFLSIIISSRFEKVKPTFMTFNYIKYSYVQNIIFSISSFSSLFQPTTLCSEEVEVSHNLSDPPVVLVRVLAKTLAGLSF